MKEFRSRFAVLLLTGAAVVVGALYLAWQAAWQAAWPDGEMAELQDGFTVASHAVLDAARPEVAPRFDHRAARNSGDFEDWQSRLRAHLRNRIFRLDQRGSAPRYRVARSATLTSGIERQEVVLLAADRLEIPAVILRPAAANGAGIIAIPGHVRDGQSGLAHLTQETASYHNSAALRLAEAGYTTIAIELRGFGALGPPGHPNHLRVAYNSILEGGFYKQKIVADLDLALRYLLTVERVDGNRIGVAGVSLGGEIATVYAAIEQRIAAVSVHAYGGGIGRFPPADALSMAQPHYCHIVPGSADLYLREAPFLLVAPRPLQAIRGELNPYALRLFEPAVIPYWKLAGAPTLVEIRNMPGYEDDKGHAFFVDEAIRFFDAVL